MSRKERFERKLEEKVEYDADIVLVECEEAKVELVIGGDVGISMIEVEEQGVGIGSDMVQALIEVVEGDNQLNVIGLDSAPDSMGFWEKMGFEHVDDEFETIMERECG